MRAFEPPPAGHLKERTIFVIARERLDLVPELIREFRGESIEFIVDRRQGQRRRKAAGAGRSNRRRSERRVREIARQLERIGFAVVVIS